MIKLLSRPALIVTNDKWLGAAVTNTLTTLQYNVDTVNTIESALKVVDKKPYLLIIAIDSKHGHINLVKLYHSITRKCPNFAKKFIFLPDGYDEVLLDLCFSKNCHFVQRPFRPANLVIELEAMRTKQLLNETRTENRYNWTGACNLSLGRKIFATSLDISNRGLKVFYTGEKAITDAEAIIHLPYIGIETKAQIKWHKYTGTRNIIGFDLVDSIDSEDLKKIIPFAS